MYLYIQNQKQEKLDIQIPDTATLRDFFNQLAPLLGVSSADGIPCTIRVDGDDQETIITMDYPIPEGNQEADRLVSEHSILKTYTNPSWVRYLTMSSDAMNVSFMSSNNLKPEILAITSKTTRGDLFNRIVDRFNLPKESPIVLNYGSQGKNITISTDHQEADELVLAHTSFSDSLKCRFNTVWITDKPTSNFIHCASLFESASTTSTDTVSDIADTKHDPDQRADLMKTLDNIIDEFGAKSDKGLDDNSDSNLSTPGTSTR